MIKNNNIFFYLHKFSKSLLFFVILFFLLNFQKSLSFLPFFEIATPNLISIILYLSIIRFRINPSNTTLFLVGLVHDIITGANLGITSIFLLLLKYLTESLFLDRLVKKSDDEWISFTIIFLFSFSIVLLLNVMMNLSTPQFSPVFFHIGITLILFPFINISINFFSFVTKLIKS